jgi:hypothetical protein
MEYAGTDHHGAERAGGVGVDGMQAKYNWLDRAQFHPQFMLVEDSREQ